MRWNLKPLLGTSLILCLVASCNVTPTLDATYTPTPNQARPTTTPDAPTPQPMETHDPTRLPGYVLDFEFVDASQGWLVGLYSSDGMNHFAMASTSNGGRDWIPVPLPPIDPTVNPGGESIGNNGLMFVDKDHGWFYFRGTYATNDGGETWTRVPIEGTVEQMYKTADGNVLALVRVDGEQRLLQATGADFDAWKDLNWSIPIGASAGDMVFDAVNSAWFMTRMKGAQGEYDWKLYRTTDGSRTWIELAAPCGGGQMNLPKLAASDSEHIWAGCGDVLGGGQGIKQVYASSNGGVDWSQVAGSEIDSTRELGMNGWGIFEDIGAKASGLVYLSFARRASLLVSTDGGQTWSDQDMNGCGSDGGRAAFLDDAVGWYVSGNCIARTTDGGGHWSCIMLPDLVPCPMKE